MLNGNGQMEGGVALLVDFENLALGVEGGREVDCAALLTLAAGFGRCAVRMCTPTGA